MRRNRAIIFVTKSQFEEISKHGLKRTYPFKHGDFPIRFLSGVFAWHDKVGLPHDESDYALLIDISKVKDGLVNDFSEKIRWLGGESKDDGTNYKVSDVKYCEISDYINYKCGDGFDVPEFVIQDVENIKIIAIRKFLREND